MPRIGVDTSEWPLLAIEFPGEPIGDGDMRAYLGELAAIARADAPHASITDLSRMTAPLTTHQRWMFDEFLRRDGDRMRRHHVGNAIVATRSLIRSGVRTAYWNFCDPPAFKLFADRQAARAWCDERIARARLAVSRPPHRRQAAPVSWPVVPCVDVLDLFSEPAFVLTGGGSVAYSNRAARRIFSTPPSWLASAISGENADCPATMRVARVDHEGHCLYVVILGEGTAVAELPPSLERVARLLARGWTDKEIAGEIRLSVGTVRTYVRRLYRRAGVHSRSEFTRLWMSR